MVCQKPPEDLQGPAHLGLHRLQGNGQDFCNLLIGKALHSMHKENQTAPGRKQFNGLFHRRLHFLVMQFLFWSGQFRKYLLQFLLVNFNGWTLFSGGESLVLHGGIKVGAGPRRPQRSGRR